MKYDYLIRDDKEILKLAQLSIFWSLPDWYEYFKLSEGLPL